MRGSCRLHQVEEMRHVTFVIVRHQRTAIGVMPEERQRQVAAGRDRAQADARHLRRNDGGGCRSTERFHRAPPQIPGKPDVLYSRSLPPGLRPFSVTSADTCERKFAAETVQCDTPEVRREGPGEQKLLLSVKVACSSRTRPDRDIRGSVVAGPYRLISAWGMAFRDARGAIVREESTLSPLWDLDGWPLLTVIGRRGAYLCVEVLVLPEDVSRSGVVIDPPTS